MSRPDANMAPQGGWFSRNWKWAVPVGCLSLIASCFGALAVGFFAISGALKDNAAYMHALGIAMADDEVQATLGPPISPGGMPQGSIKTENGRDSVSISSSLKGSKAEGLLRVEASKMGGNWTYRVFQVEVPGQEPIDLRHKVGGAPQERQPPPTPPGRQPGNRQMAPPTPDAPPPPGNTQEVQPEDTRDEAMDEAEDGAQGGDGDTPM